MTKTLDTLVEDIYGLFNPAETHVPDEEHIKEVGEQFMDLLRTRLAKREKVDDPLRFSSLGKPDRQLWHMAKGTDGEPLTAKTYFKFLYGDVIELLVLFLAKEAGHSVERQQEEIEVDGVKGHIDAILDGVVVDVKSASPYGYTKFKHNDVLSNDVFGYGPQLAGYSSVLNPGEDAAWVAFDKVGGDICVSPLKAKEIEKFDSSARIEHLREIFEQDEPPEKCYEDKPEGKSGNRILDTGCSYCAYKHACWPNLRTFLYSNGPKYFTHVEREPAVFELKPEDVVKP